MVQAVVLAAQEVSEVIHSTDWPAVTVNCYPAIHRCLWNSTCCCCLVSTYVVCERLSVMHEPAGVVEILVQILQNTPILKYRIPPLPENENCQRSWHFDFSVSE